MPSGLRSNTTVTVEPSDGAAGVSKYWGITLAAERHSAPWLDLLAAYTFSWGEDNWLGPNGGGPSAQLNPFPGSSLGFDWAQGPTDFDVPHRIVIGAEGKISGLLAGARVGAFYRFDESRVKEYTLTYYGDLYPELYTYKYPKAGEDNSLVDIYVYHLENKQTALMDTGDETDQYIPRIKWTSDPGILSILRMNRHQNQLDILHADAETGESDGDRQIRFAAP